MKTSKHYVAVSRGWAVALPAFAFLLSLACVGFAAFTVQDSAKPAQESRFETLALEVNDIPCEEQQKAIHAGWIMPLYLQDDIQWSRIDYAEGTIGDSGCGLSCAAMAIEYLTGQIVTPLDLEAIVGSTCTVYGVNDMARFGAYMSEAYGLRTSEIYYDLDRALSEVTSSSVVFAGVRGELWERAYGGHIVCIWKTDGDSVYIRDPASGANSQHRFTVEELRGTEWLYFYTTSKGEGR